MSEIQKFRTALGGFNKEDVVHYIEYLNQKNSNRVNGLESQLQTLQTELETVKAALEETRAELSAKENDPVLRQTQEENMALRAELARLKLELTQSKDSAARELETFRRAERMERAARERSDLIYRQAVGALAEATTMVDGSAVEFGKISERVLADLTQLRDAVQSSHAALQAATSTMYAIRPETQE